MNQTQILKISDKYASILQSMGSAPHRYDTSLSIQSGSPHCAYDHCLWMCMEIKVEVDPEKALRWICFIQGCLWSFGVLSIDSMREDNRLILDKSI